MGGKMACEVPGGKRVMGICTKKKPGRDQAGSRSTLGTLNSTFSCAVSMVSTVTS